MDAIQAMREKMESEKWTPSGLARAAGVSRMTVWNVLNRKTVALAMTAQRLAKVVFPGHANKQNAFIADLSTMTIASNDEVTHGA